jgi:hypothetical protein
MPPLVLAPVVKWALASVGAAAVIHWVVTEARRFNEELDRIKATPQMDPVMREALPTLRRDPRTGEYRVM